jgi:subtilase family serine protease
MASRVRIGLIVAVTTLVGLSGQLGARQRPPGRSSGSPPNFDIRDHREPAQASGRARDAMDRAASARTVGRRSGARLHPHTGSIRVLDAPGWTIARSASGDDVARLLRQSAEALGLEEDDLGALALVRDYVSASTGLRHVTFAQSLDGLPVFGGAITVHVGADGGVVRVSSSAARGAVRLRNPLLTAEAAAMTAADDVAPAAAFIPARLGATADPNVARFARGRFQRDVTAALEWFAMDGGARLAWHVEIEPPGAPQFYDVLVDAASGELLLRRNRVLDAEGTGRVIQSAATQASDPRRPDQMPAGSGACPPVLNHELRDLASPFRDPLTVLGNTGRLAGNNAHVYRGNTSTEGALGTFDGVRWTFDDPFNSAASAETALFFALNFAHDFFYDLGFDESAGNFQVDNFGRGGIGGDPIRGLARAAGRNNATFQPAPDGSSPIMSMFLFNGTGCWAEDVDGDGSLDLDGDYDTDIVLHEYHHGVSHRLNTAFNGAEADAIGEGGSDFFAYTVNGDTTLAEFALPGGIRGVNGKTYANWTCLLIIFCEPHDNGEIWVNALWDLRERFRADLVRGSEAAAINEASQLYIDGLKLSPPSPTMLDLRDAMLLADSLRNPGVPQSQNFCAIWESFAGRGMGVNATDTAANGFNQVSAGFGVPAGCVGPPVPLTVSISATATPATEAGPTNGALTVRRSEARSTPLTVHLSIGGSATPGADYQPLPTSVTIPADALSIAIPVIPFDDATVEVNESVAVSVLAGPGYAVSAPSSASVTIVSDDATPDLTVTALTVPAVSGANLTISVTDTTRNQGAGAVAASSTTFYLSLNNVVDAGDTLLASRELPALTPGATHTSTTPLTIPGDTTAGTYRIIAKADGASQLVEASESNNTRAALIRIGPDLALTLLSVPANIGGGVPFQVSYTTTNQGGAASPGPLTRFYLSSNFGHDETDVALQSNMTGALNVGASQAAAVTLTIPAETLGGLYYLIAVIDDGNAIAESSETNNTRYAATRVGSDLRVTALVVPARASVGSSFVVTDTTKNMGVSRAGSSRTAFYLSSDTRLDLEDFSLDVYREVEALDPNIQSVGPTTIVLPPAAGPGVWYVLANADDAGVVDESIENNNLKYAAVSVGADLGVSAASVPGTVTAGATVTVNDTVKNSGPDTAGTSTTRFYLSLNTALDATDILLEALRPVPSLPFNATSSGPTTLTIPTGLSGRYYLLVVADGDRVVAEASEANNVRVLVTTIMP